MGFEKFIEYYLQQEGDEASFFDKLDDLQKELCVMKYCTLLNSYYEKANYHYSIDPEFLMGFHAWSSDKRSLINSLASYLKEIISRKDNTHEGNLNNILILCELLLVQDSYSECINLAEKVHYYFPNDLRVQDAIFRANFYLKYGKSHRIGYELENFFCKNPFDRFEILPSGFVHQCCAVFLRTSIGNVFFNSMNEIWNSETAMNIRKSMHDGSFRFCGKLTCREISNIISDKSRCNSLPVKNSGMIANKSTYLETYPEFVNVSYDSSCNLYCTSCRTEKIMASEEQLIKLEEATRDVVIPLLKKAKTVHLTGAGDPFASKTIRKLLGSITDEEFPDLAIELATNGILLSPDEWKKFENLNGKITRITISMDAATSETYSKLRRGGDFRKLIQNLFFVGDLLNNKAIRNFCLCFVIQKSNFTEMEDFIKIAKMVGANEVNFQLLQNWGTFSATEYGDNAIHLPNHPMHKEYLEILKSPLFNDSINETLYISMPPIV